MPVLDNVLPALNLAKAGVTGIGIVGVELAINTVLELATMLSTMKSNKEDLSELQECLDTFIAIDVSRSSDDLKIRLTTLASKLKAISVDCKSLGEKHGFRRFWTSKEDKEKIQGIKDSISSHIRDFTFYGNISIEKSVDDLVTKVQKALANETLANIKCVAARYNSENTPDMCMKGTRVGVIEEIVTCLTSAAPDLSQRIVMLSGSAGSGKSTIAKTVASSLAKDKFLAASFFFSRDHAKRAEIRFLPCTIARQLADHDPGFERLLVKLLDDDKTGILSAEPRLQFQKLVVELVAKVPASQTPWIICLEALDECGKDRGQVVLRWLADSIAQMPTHVRFLLTGRPDVPSYLKVDALHPLMRGIILDELDPTVVERDIQLYVEQSLDGSTWTTRDSWKAEAPEVKEITKRAGGLFVFAATAVRYILGGLPQTHPRSSVEYLLKKSAPLTGLDDLYHRVVDEAISLPNRRDLRAQDSRDRAVLIVSTILHLFEPLDPHDLAALLDMDVEDLRRTLLPLGAVIRVPDAPGSTIQIIHLSFREFMTSSILDRRPDLLCGTEDQQRSVSSNLIRVLQNELKFNICELPTSYLRNVDMPRIQWRLDTYIPHHIRYSCQYWADHLAATSFHAVIAQEAGEFVLDKLLFWLEVLSLLGLVGYAPLALGKFVAWTKDETHVRFASDAKHFIAFFAPAIIQSAPHIYVSALALAPARSEISATFRSHFLGLLSVTKGGMETWPATIAVLEGHSSQVNTVAISPDGKHIVSGSIDEALRVWDVETGEALWERNIPQGSIYSVAFSPDGKYIVSGSSDSFVRIWDVWSAEEIAQRSHQRVRFVAFSPDAKSIVSASRENINIWDVNSGNVKVFGRRHRSCSVVFSSDGKHIASGSLDGTVCIWDVESGKAIAQRFKGHKGKVISIAFLPDGKHVVSGSDDNIVCMWDAESGEAIGQPFEGYTSKVTSIAFSADRKCLVSGSEDNTVRMWDVESGKAIGQPFEGHVSQVLSVAFSADGKRIVSGSKDGTVRIFDAESVEVVAESFEGHHKVVGSVAFSHDGKRLVCSSVEGAICVWDAESGKALLQPRLSEGRIISVAFSPDGTRLVGCSNQCTFSMWDAESGEALGQPFSVMGLSCTPWFTSDSSGPALTSAALSPDSKRVVSCNNDHTVCIWDVESRQTLGQPLGLVGQTHQVQSVAFSPDGRHIVSGSAPGINIWDLQSGEAVGEMLSGHANTVISVAFSQDGKYIVSGSRDHTFRIWDAQNGDAVGEPFECSAASVRSLAFSPDGRYIASAHDDKTVRIWDVESVTFQWESIETYPTSDLGNQLDDSSSSAVSSHWRLHEGWMSQKSSELLFWLPKAYRTGFWMPNNTLVISRQQTKLSHANFMHGTEWTKCYSPQAGI